MRRAHHLAAAVLAAAALSLAPTIASAEAMPGTPADHPVTAQSDDHKADDHGTEQQKPEDKDHADRSDHDRDGKDRDDKDRGDKDHGDKDHGDKDRGREHTQDWADGSHDGEHRPHGGVHTGGGFGALTADHSLATGSVLLAGGLAVGALALRRRKPARPQA
ncbi:hypothetical protein ACFYNO_00150 [Kitasatospora sp. NPDC006697]|uniref:hypothetical protein n=1 Tax=Kitasatospora sp. NPDC006697 TaxID=3364020 RepID=UPI0036B32B2A